MKKFRNSFVLATLLLGGLTSCTPDDQAHLYSIGDTIDTGDYKIRLVTVNRLPETLRIGDDNGKSDFIISFEISEVKKRKLFEKESIKIIANQEIIEFDQDYTAYLNGGEELDNNFIESPKVAFKDVPTDDYSLGIKFMAANFRVSHKDIQY